MASCSWNPFGHFLCLLVIQLVWNILMLVLVKVADIYLHFDVSF